MTQPTQLMGNSFSSPQLFRAAEGLTSSCLKDWIKQGICLDQKQRAQYSLDEVVEIFATHACVALGLSPRHANDIARKYFVQRFDSFAADPRGVLVLVVESGSREGLQLEHYMPSDKLPGFPATADACVAIEVDALLKTLSGRLQHILAEGDTAPGGSKS